MTATRTNGVVCVVPIWIKLLILAAAVLCAYFGVWRVLDNHILGWLLLFYVFGRIPFYSPDVTLFDEGVEINRFGFKRFLVWDDFDKIRIGKINCQLVPRNIPQMVRLFLFEAILLNSWRTNFDKAREILKQHQVKAGVQTPQRAYE